MWNKGIRREMWQLLWERNSTIEGYLHAKLQIAFIGSFVWPV